MPTSFNYTQVWKRSGAWFHKSLPKGSLHSSCPTSPLSSKSLTTVDGWTSLLARGPAEFVTSTNGTHASDDDWTRIESKLPLSSHFSTLLGNIKLFYSCSVKRVSLWMRGEVPCEATIFENMVRRLHGVNLGKRKLRFWLKGVSLVQ